MELRVENVTFLSPDAAALTYRIYYGGSPSPIITDPQAGPRPRSTATGSSAPHAVLARGARSASSATARRPRRRSRRPTATSRRARSIPSRARVRRARRSRRRRSRERVAAIAGGDTGQAAIIAAGVHSRPALHGKTALTIAGWKADGTDRSRSCTRCRPRAGRRRRGRRRHGREAARRPLVRRGSSSRAASAGLAGGGAPSLPARTGSSPVTGGYRACCCNESRISVSSSSLRVSGSAAPSTRPRAGSGASRTSSSITNTAARDDHEVHERRDERARRRRCRCTPSPHVRLRAPRGSREVAEVRLPEERADEAHEACRSRTTARPR